MKGNYFVYIILIVLLTLIFLFNYLKYYYNNKYFIFEDAKQCSDNVAPVKIEGNWGYINKMGEIVISPKYNNADIMKEGYAPIKIEDEWAYINYKGE